MQKMPSRKIEGRISRVLKAAGQNFVSQETDVLVLGYGGIKGDYHEGLTRNSGAREPWYERGTEMRNERQLTLLSEDDLNDIASRMGLGLVDPGWIGANIVTEGIPDFSYLPPRTLLMFENGVTLRVDGYNAPCTEAGGSIARHIGEQAENHRKTDTALSFVKAADMKRGVVAWVERKGEIRAGDKFTARIWEQWIYE